MLHNKKGGFMMKERYTEPEMSIVLLEVQDVITSSETELPPVDLTSLGW